MGRDYIADLHEDLNAEQKARATYEYLLDLTDDPDVIKPLSFLRQEKLYIFNVLVNYLMTYNYINK